MPSNYTSPFATSFKSAVRRGTPCSVAVQNIAKRNNKTTKMVFESLFKAGLCFRQKFNGQWLYWPVEAKATNATNWKMCQTNMWQSFVDWCICSGACTPQQMKKNTGSQVEFSKWCKKFWAGQFSTSTATTRKTRTTPKRRPSTTSKRRTATARSRKTTTRTRRTSGNRSNYSFSTSRTTGRRVRRAA